MLFVEELKLQIFPSKHFQYQMCMDWASRSETLKPDYSGIRGLRTNHRIELNPFIAAYWLFV
jgi:hypothetical protein